MVVAMGAEGGAVAAIIAAASHGGEAIDGVVAENPFTTGEAMLQVGKRERKRGRERGRERDEENTHPAECSEESNGLW